tara:strand:- start:55 stop:381 length:327 start_codon:yes stop_codon:yes gene_type:complete
MSYRTRKAGGLAARAISAALAFTIVADTTHVPSKHTQHHERGFLAALYGEKTSIVAPTHPKEPPHHPHIELREPRQRRLEMALRRGRNVEGDELDLIGFEPQTATLDA